MEPLQIETVPCFLHEQVQDETVPLIPKGLPFSSQFMDNLLEACPVVTRLPEMDNNSAKLEELYDQSGFIAGSALGLRRISSEHGRSYEFIFGNKDQSPQVIWQDEFRNEFGSLTIKGANFTDPRIMQSLTAPSGYIPYGLLETDAFVRVMRASRLMREKHIDTEMIVRVLEPKVLRYRQLDPATGQSVDESYEYVTQEEFKRRLLQDHWRSIAEEPEAVDEFAKVCTAINGMSYFFTIRAMGVGTRIKDLSVDNKQIFMNELSKVSRHINAVVTDPKLRLEIDNPEDVHDYVFKQLPATIGANLGKMHRMGLVHTFPVMGNITIFGELVDLDAVKGEPLGLGDKAVTDEDFENDIAKVLGLEMEDALEQAAFFISATESIGHDSDRDENQKLYNIYFYNSYIHARWGSTDTSAKTPFEESTLLSSLPEILRLNQQINNSIPHNVLLPILEATLDSTDFPDCFPSDFSELAGASYASWIQPQLDEALQQGALEFIAATPMRDLDPYSTYWFSQKTCNEMINGVGSKYCREKLINPELRSAVNQQRLSNWIHEHRRTDSTWSEAGLVQLLNQYITLIKELELDDYHVRNHADTSRFYHLSPLSILRDSFYWEPGRFEPVKIPADGYVFHVRDQVTLKDTLKFMYSPQRDYEVQLNHAGGSAEAGIKVKVPDGYTLTEIITDGQVEEINVEEHGSAWVGSATVEIVNNGSCSYFVYVLQNKEDGHLSPYFVE